MTQHGSIGWYELITTNERKSTAFYSELFNWKIDSTKMCDSQGDDYKIFKTDTAKICGVSKPIAGISNMWLAYINVDNLDSTINAIKAGGGLILDSQEIKGMVKWVVAKDPEGGIFSPVQTLHAEPAKPYQQEAPKAGEFCWHELMCLNMKTSLPFYQKIFGWKETQSIDMGPMGVYQLYSSNQKDMGGFMNITKEMPLKQATWVDYICVKNVDETVTRAQQLGAQITFQAMNLQNNHGRIAGLVDSMGTAFDVFQAL